MIAEESTSWTGVTRSAAEGGLDFDLKWNMGWTHDILQYFSRDPIYRKWHHHEPRFCYALSIFGTFLQVFSHDEVVHGKGSLLHRMPGPLDYAEGAWPPGPLHLHVAVAGKENAFHGL